MISLGLIGYPLAHSLSPRIHNEAIKNCGLECNYLLYPIQSDDLQGLKNILDKIRDGVLTGVNVTIPHKQNVVAFLDELTPVAKSIGAVNTIYMSKGKLIGENTDSPGFLTDLNRILAAEHYKKGLVKKALVLGAGGSAHAITYALVNNGWNVIISSRKPEQSERLIAQFPENNSALTRIDYDANGFNANILDRFLVINATPVGMSPAIDKSPWPEGMPLPPVSVIYDLVYSPRETKFIKDARLAGHQAFNGLGMLVEQAALAFKIWTGFDVARHHLFAAVEEK
jgi:shikimate dehydrogenase